MVALVPVILKDVSVLGLTNNEDNNVCQVPYVLALGVPSISFGILNIIQKPTC